MRRSLGARRRRRRRYCSSKQFLPKLRQPLHSHGLQITIPIPIPTGIKVADVRRQTMPRMHSEGFSLGHPHQLSRPCFRAVVFGPARSSALYRARRPAFLSLWGIHEGRSGREVGKHAQEGSVGRSRCLLKTLDREADRDWWTTVGSHH